MIVCPACERQFKGNSLGAHVLVCSITPVQIFWSKVDKSAGQDSCWLWRGAGHRDGYGRVNFRKHGKQGIRIAHRIAWEIANGREVLEGMDVLHRCDVRLCCNPDHLLLGTHPENMADMAAKGRQTKGEKNRWATLTDAQAREILANPPVIKRGGRRNSQAKEYAERYGTTPAVICALVRGETWKHIPRASAADIGEC